MAKRKVEIFIGPIACSCAGGLTPAKQEKVTRALVLKSALERNHSDKYDVEYFDLGDDAAYDESLKLLRRRLEEAGEHERAAGAAYSIKDITPAIAVDGKLEWTGDAPEADEFLRRYSTL